jgi:hypothetical protein
MVSFECLKASRRWLILSWFAVVGDSLKVAGFESCLIESLPKKINKKITRFETFGLGI